MTRRGAVRFGVVLGLVLMLLAGVSGVASADTVVPPVASDASAIADWPVALQQLVAGTAAFQAGPWYTDPSCKGRGGNVGIYINDYLAHEKDFWLQLAKSTNQGSNASDAQKFIDAAGGTSGFDTWPGAAKIGKYSMPTQDACADTLKSWATPDATSVWGFAWVATPDETSMSQMMKIAVPTGDDLDPHNVALWGANSDTAYLKSRAMYVNCDQAAPNQQTSCTAWNYAVQNLIVGTDQWKAAHTSFWSNVGLFVKMAGFGIITSPTWVMVGAGFVLGLVGKTAQAALDWAGKKGMDQVVSFFTAGLVTMWAAFTSWMVNFTTPNLAAGGFMQVYNIIGGIMYGLSFLGWLLALAVAWRRGKLGRSFLGGFRAVLAIQLIPVIAYLMLTLARESTKLLISGHVDAIQSAKFATSLVAVNPVVALLAGIFGTIGLVVALIILVFQIPLVYGHALFGVIAGAGQANPATSGWLSKWFFTFLSLCWTPFFMVGLAILGQDLTAGLDSNTTQNVGQQMVTVLGGLLIMVLLPTTPWLLSGIMSVTTGRVSAQADAIGEGAGMDLAGAAASAGSDLTKAGAAAAGASAAGTWGALAAMGSNLLLLDAAAGGSGRDGAGVEGGDAAGGGSSRGASDGSSGVLGAAASGAAAGGPAGAAVAAAGALVGGAMAMAAGTGAEDQAGGPEAGGVGESNELGAEPGAGESESGSPAVSMAKDLGSAGGGEQAGGEAAEPGAVLGAEAGGELAAAVGAGAPDGRSAVNGGATGGADTAGGGAAAMAAASGASAGASGAAGAGSASAAGISGGTAVAAMAGGAGSAGAGAAAAGGGGSSGPAMADGGQAAVVDGRHQSDPLTGGLAGAAPAGMPAAAESAASGPRADAGSAGLDGGGSPAEPAAVPAAAAAGAGVSPTDWFKDGAPTSAQLDAARGGGFDMPEWAATQAAPALPAPSLDPGGPSAPVAVPNAVAAADAPPVPPGGSGRVSSGKGR